MFALRPPHRSPHHAGGLPVGPPHAAPWLCPTVGMGYPPRPPPPLPHPGGQRRQERREKPQQKQWVSEEGKYIIFSCVLPSFKRSPTLDTESCDRNRPPPALFNPLPSISVVEEEKNKEQQNEKQKGRGKPLSETSALPLGYPGCRAAPKKRKPKHLFLSANKREGKRHFHLPLSHSTDRETEAQSRERAAADRPRSAPRRDTVPGSSTGRTRLSPAMLPITSHPVPTPGGVPVGLAGTAVAASDAPRAVRRRLAVLHVCREGDSRLTQGHGRHQNQPRNLSLLLPCSFPPPPSPLSLRGCSGWATPKPRVTRSTLEPKHPLIHPKFAAKKQILIAVRSDLQQQRTGALGSRITDSCLNPFKMHPLACVSLVLIYFKVSVSLGRAASRCPEPREADSVTTGSRKQ